MSDGADKTLELLIKTKADLAAAIAAEATLKKQVQAAQLLGKSYEKQEAQLKKVSAAIAESRQRFKEVDQELNNLSPATLKYIQQLEEQTAAENKAKASKREIRRILHELGTQFPVVGEIGRIAMLGVVGAVMLLVKVFSAASDAIKEMGNVSTPEFGRLTDAVEKQKEAMDEVNTAGVIYEASLKRMASATETVRDASAAYLDKLKTQAEQQSALAEASNNRQSAMLEEMEKMGFITHAQYLQKKFALDGEYARKRLKMENDLQLKQTAEKFRERFNTIAENSTLEGQIAAARTRASSATGKESFAKDILAKDKDDLKKTQDDLQKLETEHQELVYKTGKGRFTTLTPQYILEKEKSTNEALTVGAIAEIASLQRRIQQGQKNISDKGAEAGIANDDLHALEDRRRENTKRIAELDRQLPRDQSALADATNNRNQVSAISRDEAAIKNLPDALALAGDINKASPATLRTLLEVLQETRRQQSETINTLRNQHKNTDDLTTVVANLNNEIRIVQTRIHSLLN